MKFDGLNRRLREMETDLATTEERAGDTKFGPFVTSKFTDDELLWVADVLRKNCFGDDEVQERFWDIMGEHGWFDKENAA